MEKEENWASSNKEEERSDLYFQQNNMSQPAENLLWIQWVVFDECVISRGLWLSCSTGMYEVFLFMGKIATEGLCKQSMLFGFFT